MIDESLTLHAMAVISDFLSAVLLRALYKEITHQEHLRYLSWCWFFMAGSLALASPLFILPQSPPYLAALVAMTAVAVILANLQTPLIVLSALSLQSAVPGKFGRRAILSIGLLVSALVFLLLWVNDIRSAAEALPYLIAPRILMGLALLWYTLVNLRCHWTRLSLSVIVTGFFCGAFAFHEMARGVSALGFGLYSRQPILWLVFGTLFRLGFTFGLVLVVMNEAVRLENRLGRFWEASLDAMCLVDREGIIHRINAAGCSLASRARTELEGNPFTRCFLGREEQFYRHSFQSRIAEWPVNSRIEKEYTRWDGQKKWLDISISQVGSSREELFLFILRDCTERKRAENDFRNIFNSFGDAIFIYDAGTGDLLDVNQTMLDMYGLTRQEVMDFDPETPRKSSPLFSREEARNWGKTVFGKGPQEFEWSLSRKNGETFWAEVCLRNCWIGGTNRLLASVRDITQRKKAELALKESEERLKLALEAQGSGIWEYDLRNNCILIDQRISAHMGLPSDGGFKVFEDWERLTHPDDLEKANNALQSYLRGETPIYEIESRHRHVDGHYICAYAKGRIFEWGPEGQPLRLIGTSTDITAHKKTEEEAQHLKDYLDDMINFMPSVLIGMNREKQVLRWNRRAEEFTGISSSDAVGKPIAILLPDYAHWIESMHRRLENSRPVTKEKLLMVRNGVRRNVDLVLYPLSTGGVDSSVLRIEDVTEKTQIQELMVQTEKMISIGGLAAGMAHEINNPLGIISQSIQSLQRRTMEDIPANRRAAESLGISLNSVQAYLTQREIPQFTQYAQEAVTRAMKIVSNMLAFSRKSESAKQLSFLEPILERSVELAGNDYDLKKRFDFRNIDIVRDYQPDMPATVVSVVEVEQVFLNLVKNAAQALAGNPPEKKPVIRLRLRSAGGYAITEIEDNGPGMTDDLRFRIFEPFFTTKPPGVGTGLGLSVSYTIVTQNHKGLMEVDSTPGEGSCFRVRLPLAPAG